MVLYCLVDHGNVEVIAHAICVLAVLALRAQSSLCSLLQTHTLRADPPVPAGEEETVVVVAVFCMQRRQGVRLVVVLGVCDDQLLSHFDSELFFFKLEVHLLEHLVHWLLLDINRIVDEV